MKDYERGQILLIVVLVMTIALTIGISVATRTISNLRTTSEQESSQRAFSAAEAGIEVALQNNIATSGAFTNNASYDTSVSAFSGRNLLLQNGSVVFKDTPVDVWLATYPNYTAPWTGNITVYWGTSSDTCNTSEALNTRAALEIVLISGTKANPQLTHYPVDPCPARAGFNQFESIPSLGGTVLGRQFAYRKTIAVASGLILRIIPLYASARIGVIGCNGAGSDCNDLPAQGTMVTSIGTSDTTQRKVVGVRSYPSLPREIFPYIIFSPQ
jgi:hypothetical protein